MNAGGERDSKFDPWVGRVPGEEHGHSVFLPEGSRGQKAWGPTVPGVTKSDLTERLLMQAERDVNKQNKASSDPWYRYIEDIPVL